MALTEREQEMIRFYLPGEPDPELEEGEYYYLQTTAAGERVIRVFPIDIYPYEHGTEYGIYQTRSGRLCRVDTGAGPYHGVTKAMLYDNKTDCRDQSHMFFDRWEELRERQREEQEKDGGAG